MILESMKIGRQGLTVGVLERSMPTGHVRRAYIFVKGSKGRRGLTTNFRYSSLLEKCSEFVAF